MLMWERGYACVFPEGAEQPLWVPLRLGKVLGANEEPVSRCKETDSQKQ